MQTGSKLKVLSCLIRGDTQSIYWKFTLLPITCSLLDLDKCAFSMLAAKCSLRRFFYVFNLVMFIKHVLNVKSFANIVPMTQYCFKHTCLHILSHISMNYQLPWLTVDNVIKSIIQ